jgi:hypothetical protein
MVVFTKDLQNFYGVSRPTAIKLKKEIMNYFNVPSGRIWSHHLAKYEGLTVSEVEFILKGN